MKDSLSKLLIVFDRKCSQIVESFPAISDEDDIKLLIEQNRQLSKNGKNHNSYLYATLPMSPKDSFDENTTITNPTRKKSQQLFPTAFFKIKQNIQKVHAKCIQNQTTQKNYKKTSINQKGPFQDKFSNKTQQFKPKKLGNNLFFLNTPKQDFESYRNKDFTQKAKQNFFQSYRSFKIKSKIQKQQEFQKSQFNEILENNYVYCLQKGLMAPKKQKLKKLKSNQQHQ